MELLLTRATKIRLFNFKASELAVLIHGGWVGGWVGGPSP
jgi:hypothetical protein